MTSLGEGWLPAQNGNPPRSEPGHDGDRDGDDYGAEPRLSLIHTPLHPGAGRIVQLKVKRLRTRDPPGTATPRSERWAQHVPRAASVWHGAGKRRRRRRSTRPG